MPLFSYISRLGRRTLVFLRNHPSKVKRYPFSSTRQHERHAARQYTATTRNGFHIMQTGSRRKMREWHADMAASRAELIAMVTAAGPRSEYGYDRTVELSLVERA